MECSSADGEGSSSRLNANFQYEQENANEDEQEEKLVHKDRFDDCETPQAQNDSLKRKLADSLEVNKKIKVSEDSSDPDVDQEINTPDVLEVLKSGSKIMYSCNKCRDSCDSLKDFNVHSKEHSGADDISFTKFYTCSLCMYACKKPASLLKHIDKHGKRKYGCEACDYTTNRPSVLKTHMLTHSASRPFACTECSFRATQEGYLRHHYAMKHNITHYIK